MRTSLLQCRKAYIAGEPEEECMRYGPSPEIEINYLQYLYFIVNSH